MNNRLIEWDDRYSVGIDLIDEQHRELVSQINNLCLGCQKNGKEAKNFFDLNIQALLRYMNYHFAAEEKMLEHIKYPDLAAHRKQHSSLLSIVADRAGYIEQEDVPHLLAGNRLWGFVSYLRDMLFSHIAILDKKYVSHIHFLDLKAGVYAAEPLPPTELFFG